jgi:hypothetical protein
VASTPGVKPRRRLRWLLAVLTLGVVGAVAVGFYLRKDANPGCEAGGKSACTRVYFIGNSYTAVNDLPTVFADLAWSGGHRVETGVQAPGGWKLADHDTSDTGRTIAAAKWDFVVLQEQSEIPSDRQLRESYMYPAAQDLVAVARNAGAQPMFFLTWAHRNGWPADNLPDYASMQASIDAGYLFIAGQQHAAIAPVGFAWKSIVDRESDPGLWQDDGSHPTEKGTYLAACVFYASVFLESPVGLKYQAGLSDADAADAQHAAATTVLGDPSKWGLP